MTQAKIIGQLFCGDIATPLGKMVAISDMEHLLLLEFEDRQELDDEMKCISSKTGCSILNQTHPMFELVEKELDGYFRDPMRRFTVPIRLLGTPFETLVWNELRDIPPGETLAYSQMAEKIGKPAASRAVGRANGKNPIAIVVPCHRLISANGNLIGYGGGLWRKKWLLDHEKKRELRNF